MSWNRHYGGKKAARTRAWNESAWMREAYPESTQPWPPTPEQIKPKPTLVIGENGMAKYNPEQPLVNMIAEVQAVQTELAAAKAEYKALQEEIEKQFGERREAINARRAEAQARADAMKDRFCGEAMSVWSVVHLPNDVRKFFTTDNLITVAAVDTLEWDMKLAEAKTLDVTDEAKAKTLRDEVARAKAEFETWVRQMHPGWLVPDWSLIKKEALAGLTPMPLKIVTDNQVRVNMDKVAALGAIDEAAIVEKATEKASTKLMVQESDDAN